jgi:hypothetical protein
MYGDGIATGIKRWGRGWGDMMMAKNLSGLFRHDALSAHLTFANVSPEVLLSLHHARFDGWWSVILSYERKNIEGVRLIE